MPLFRRNTSGKTAPLDSISGLANRFDTSDESALITDADGNIRYVNPAFTALTGYSKQDAAGKTPRILKSGKHDAFFYQSIWQHLLAGRTWQGEIINRRKDGTFYVDSQTITPIIRHDDAAICGFLSLRCDRTQERISSVECRQRAEEAVFAQHVEQLRQVAQTPVELLRRALGLFLTLSEFKEIGSGLAFEVSHDEGILRLVVADGAFSPRFLAEEATRPLGRSACSKVALEGRVLVCSNCYRNPLYEVRWLGMPERSHYTIPVRTAERVLAVIDLFTNVEMDPSPRRIAFLAEAGLQLGEILDQLQRHGPAGI